MKQYPLLSAHSLPLCLVALLLVLAFSLMAGPIASPSLQADSGCNPIVIENQLPGTEDWQLTKPANDINHQIKGYASSTSVNNGDTLDFYVSVKPAQNYTIQIYRMGWYQGLGGRFMTEIGPLAGTVQAAPVLDATTGMITTPWTSDTSLTIPSSWISGIYAAKLINAAGFENYIVFVVRNDGRPADLLYQQSVTTDQAYNNYPDDGVLGKSTYDHNSYGANTVAGSKRAVKVSFDRPMTDDGAGFLFDWEYPLLRWLEKSGYDVAYSTNLDTHQNGANLLNYTGFLSTGHDEYWSKEMRDAADAGRNGGVNLAFFGANAVYWQIRFEPSAGGTPDRILTVYKNWNIDPITDNSRKTYLWRTIWQREEQKLIGVQYISYGNTSNNTDYVVTNSGHWIYDRTGFSDGDTVSGIVGYEVDSFQSNYAAPASQSQTLLSASPYLDTYGNTVIANASIYQAPDLANGDDGAWVFGAGTMSWSWALDKAGYIDARIQKTTANLLDQFTGGAPTGCGPPDPPGTVTLVSPANEISTSSPTFEWSVEPTASDYTLVVYSVTNNEIVHMESYPAASACAGNVCTAQPTLNLLPGDYTWLIQASNSAGTGMWSIFDPADP